MKSKTALALITLFVCLNMVSCKFPVDMKDGVKQGILPNRSKNMDDVMDSGPVKGGTIKLFSTVPDTLNPLLTVNMFVHDLSMLIFESLVRLDRTHMPVPVLAERWKVSNDGLVWTFYLRKKVFWHDKIPFTSEDVEFTLKTIMSNNVFSIYRQNVENIATFSALSSNVFRIILKKPYSFTAGLMTFPIIPKHYFSGEDMATSPRNMLPVGTGPFRFIEYNQKSSIVLKANENWWNAGNSGSNKHTLPYVAEVDIEIFDSVKKSIGSFQAHQVDVVPVEAGAYAKYIGRADLLTKVYPGRRFDFIAFNMNRSLTGDRNVRKAVLLAIDRDKIAGDIMPGEVTVSDIPVMPESWICDSSSSLQENNMTKAREILLQDGWKDSNGILTKNYNGSEKSLNLVMLVNDDNDQRVGVAEEIGKQLKDVGINLQVKKVKWDEEKMLLYSRSFDMVLTGCLVPSVPDISFLYSSSEIPAPGSATAYGDRVCNIAGYSNPEVDAYIGRIIKEYDINSQKTLFKNMVDIINEDVPYIGLFFYNDAMMYNKRVRGEISPYVWDRYYDIIKWYLPIR